jgi:hypothetical protein
MKMMKLVAVAVLGLTAGSAWAQTHPTAGAPLATSTVNGIFVPAPRLALGPNVTVSAPASTPVSVPTGTAAIGLMANLPAYQAAANNVAAVGTGAPAAIASFTQTLSAAGVPAAAAQGIATALQQIGTNPSVGSVATALASWNATVATMTPAQVTALIGSRAGYVALRTMMAAYRAAVATRG